MSDYELKSAINKVQNKRFNFALYKGDDKNQVLITPKPASTKQVGMIEKEIGVAKRIAKGLCFQDGTTFVFATKAAPVPAWEPMLTKIFKDHHCTNFLPVEVRQLGANESDEAAVEEEGGEGESESAPEGDRANAEWQKAVAAIEPRYFAALRGQPGNATKMRAIMALAAEKAEDGNAPAALQALKTLEGLIAAAESGAAGKETDVIPGGKVAEMRDRLSAAKQRWEAGIEAASSEIDKVQNTIGVPDMEVAAALDGLLTGYRDSLMKILELGRAVKTDADSDKLAAKARETAKELETKIAADEVFTYLDSFQETPIRLRDTFKSAFADLSKYLAN